MRSLELVSYPFPPAGGRWAAASVRLGKFAQYLPEFGWLPCVVSAGLRSFRLVDESLVFAPTDHVIRVDDPVPRFRGQDRIAPWLPSPGLLYPWAWRAAQAAAAQASLKGSALILASSPPPANFVAGYLAHRKTGLPLVLDYRDQWTLSPYRVGPSLYRKWDQFLEKTILKSAALVVVSNPGRLVEHRAFWGKVGPRAICIPNGYDVTDLERISPDRPVLQEVTEGVVIRHLGAIYGPRVSTTLSVLDALNEYLLRSAERWPVEMQFIGGMPEKIMEQRKPASPRLVVKRQGNVTHREALALEVGADVLLLLVGEHAQADAETSSKVFEYMATGRPILIAGESQQLRSLAKELPHVFWLGARLTADKFAEFFEWLSYHLAGIPRAEMCRYLDAHFLSYSRRDIARGLAEALSQL